MANTSNNVTSINKGIKGKAMDALKDQAVKGIKPVKAEDQKGNEFVLKADIAAANKYTLAYLAADSALENAERDFCKAFASNHEGHLKPAIKAGFKTLKESGAFNGLSNQTIDNLSSAAQWIAIQKYELQDKLFESKAFRKAYHAARWPVTVKAEVTKADTVASKEVKPVSQHVTPAPVQKADYNGACNEIAIELNSVIEHISDVIKAYPNHVGNGALEMLAREIGTAIEKAAHARLQTLTTPREAVAA